MFLGRLSIRTKIAVVMTSLLAIVSIAIYLYFPARLHRQMVESVTQKAAALTGMAAFSVAEGLQERNQPKVAAALAGIRSNPDLVYLLLLDERGQVFASYNDRIARDAQYERIVMQPVERTRNVLQAGERYVRPASRSVAGGMTADGALYQSMAPVQHRGHPIGRLYAGMSLDAANADAARGRATIALITAIAFLLGTLAVFALSTVITGPLQRIVDTTEDIAAGDFTKRAAVTSSDEVGHLARAFNGMVERVAGAYAQLEEGNRTLESRVRERTRELAVSEERYRLLFERNLAGVYMATEDGTVVDCNDACAQLFGYASREELLSSKIEYMHPHERDSVVRRLREHGAVTNEEVELRGRDGQPVWALENVRRIPAQDDRPAMLEGILLDIGDRKRAELDIAFKAYHDALTHLPNRALFLDRLEVALAQACRTPSTLAVLFLDLDNMKSINDTFGHAVGDRVLQSLAQRLQHTLRGGDTIARVGGDEFLVLLSNLDEAEAEELARKILKRVSEPLSVDTDELYLTTSIGVAIYPADGEDAETLIRHADSAMYRVKEAGGNDLQLSSREGKRNVGRLSLEEQLRAAIERDEFVLHFQPQVHIESRQLSGAEALVRWQRPDGTLVSPAGFMTVCEQSGIITAMGELVLTKACQQMVAWQQVGNAPPRMGVNVSARQFYQRDFVGMVERAIASTGMSPMRLELEITETVAMQTSERALDMLRHLRAMGIAVAVDDFGTGQSSLSYLKRFPVDTVKIDRSFVNDLISGENDEWIITAVLMLANHLGLRTVAEGVETEEQCAFLRGHDCREIQGYLIDKPLEADKFAAKYLARKAVERRPRAAML